ncbi:MAG: ion transporter [Caulobacteraceae bacterium]|nr:ion transporter [Caulobacteraceae bacterium]
MASRKPRRLHARRLRAGLRARLRALYHGHSREAVRFRLSVIALDILIIAFFIGGPFLRGTPLFLPVDYAIAALLALDLVARALAYSTRRRWIAQPIVWVDLFILATLLFPQWFYAFAFLRVLRLWTLFHSDFFWKTVGRRYNESRWEDVAKSVANLVTFVFVMTGFVYAVFGRRHPDVNGYVDALYFTISTLTTTGFGDITLPGTIGKLIAIVTMVTGITLFVGLAQTLMRPPKVHFPCPTCGLIRHDPDAVHCKACGQILNIPNPY